MGGSVLASAAKAAMTSDSVSTGLLPKFLIAQASPIVIERVLNCGKTES